MVLEVAVVLPNNKEVYRPGETLSGQTILDLDQPVTASAVKMYFHGQAFVSWTDYSTDVGFVGHVPVPKVKSKEIVARERYFAYVTPLWNSASSGNPQLLPGRHSWNFAFKIPNRSLPSSFEGDNGAIRYWLKVEIQKPFPRPNVKRYRCITVLAGISLGAAQYQKQVQGSNSKIVSKVLGIGNAGKLMLSAKTDKTGYCSGEDIGICATMVNETTKDMKGCKAELIQKVRCEADDKTERTETILAIVEGSKIPKGETVQWVWERLSFGAVPPSSVTGSCHILNVFYYVKIYIRVPMGFDLHVYLPVTIGTIPAGHRLGPHTAANATIPPVVYAKCNKGFRDFDRSGSGFPCMTYTPMTAFVHNAPFMGPLKGVPSPGGAVAAPLPSKRTTSLPVVTTGCLLIRFAQDKMAEFQSTIRACRYSLEEHKGQVIAVAEKVTLVSGSPWSEGQGLAILVFPGKAEARAWVSDAPEVSSPDWLDGVEITLFTMMVPHQPEIERGFYSIMLSMYPKAVSREELVEFGRVYTQPMRNLRKQTGAALIVSAASKNYENLRGNLAFVPNIFTIMQWANKEGYDKYTAALQSGEYKAAMDGWRALYRQTSLVTLDSEDPVWLAEDPQLDSTNAKADQTKTTEDVDEVGAVYLLVRFPTAKLEQFRCIVKQSRENLVTKHGKMLVLASEFKSVYYEPWPQGKSLSILRFNKKRSDAKEWYSTISADEENAWLNGSDVIVINSKEPPHDGYGAFSMNVSTVRDGMLSIPSVKETFLAVRAARLRFGGALLFHSPGTDVGYEALRGQWLLGSQRISCTQWKDRKTRKDFVESIAEERQKLRECTDTHHSSTFVSEDLSWTDPPEVDDDQAEEEEEEAEEVETVL